MAVLYTADVTATGDGRDGHVASSDGIIDVDVAVPKEMGGAGGATNPEQLFAAGYAACFHSALRVVARRAKASVEGSQVNARVGIGPSGGGGFGLDVTLTVTLPDVDPAVARQLVDAAHQVCPYSNATRGNIDVKLEIA
ncbi:organic hydroperoxide resistance protein [Dactylosporangium sp. NPDC049525]|uniref:organic hydroperoxide resistance protein n=1 Tax=Dactylosporangium sp. NPDC049525 TaxID=3154730 RepID=UPI00341F2DDF